MQWLSLSLRSRYMVMPNAPAMPRKENRLAPTSSTGTAARIRSSRGTAQGGAVDVMLHPRNSRASFPDWRST